MIKSFKVRSKKLSVFILVLFVLLASISLTNAQETTISKQVPENIELSIDTKGYSTSNNTGLTINSQTLIEYYKRNSNFTTQSAELHLPKGKPIFLTVLDKGISLVVDYYKQKLIITIKHKNGISTIYQLPLPKTKKNPVHIKFDKLDLEQSKNKTTLIANEKIPQGTKFLKVTYSENSKFTPYLRFKAVKNGNTINPLPYLQ